MATSRLRRMEDRGREWQKIREEYKKKKKKRQLWRKKKKKKKRSFESRA